MPKFICTKSDTRTFPVGTILIGELINSENFKVLQDSKEDWSNVPFFRKGPILPLVGVLWTWESVNED